MAELREYQKAAVQAAMTWVEKATRSSGVIVAPTGSGKSHIIAEIGRLWITTHPDGIILILTHSREIVRQDAQKFEERGIRVGIICAGLGRHDTPDHSTRIYIATVGSVKIQIFKNAAEEILVMIDEAHRVDIINEKTRYRRLISKIWMYWPEANLVGFTATPWRIGAGSITHSSIWRTNIYHIRQKTLLAGKFLVPLLPFSKKIYTEHQLTAAKNGGEYNLAALGEILENEEEKIRRFVDIFCDPIRVGNRKHALVFCPTVTTAEMIAEMVRNEGIAAEVVSGKTPKKIRDKILSDYKAGILPVICNCEVLTTGFDAPCTDMIVLAIATLSRTKFYQIVGRGMRIDDGKTDCLLIDGGSNIDRHGLDPDESQFGRSYLECDYCGYMFAKPDNADLLARTIGGNFWTCPSCGASLFRCPNQECGNIWMLEDPIPAQIVCKKCGMVAFPPAPQKKTSPNVAPKVRHLALDVPIDADSVIQTVSGRSFWAYAPISLQPYLSRRKNPCIRVLGAFPQKTAAYIVLSTETRGKCRRAAMGYIMFGEKIDARKADNIPIRKFWKACASPYFHILAARGVQTSSEFPEIRMFLIRDRKTGQVFSVEIASGTIMKEEILEDIKNETQQA